MSKSLSQFISLIFVLSSVFMFSSCGGSSSAGSGVFLGYSQVVFTNNGGILNLVGGNTYINAFNGDLVVFLGGGTYQDVSTGSIIFGTIQVNKKVSGGAQCLSVEECSKLAGAVQEAGSRIASLESTPAGITDSIGGQTKDIDLQQSQADAAQQAQRAQRFANEFQMDYGKALELTRLADQVQGLSNSAKMTDEDRQAISEKALAVAGISKDEVNQTIVRVVQDGDQTAVDNLMNKAASQLGMPSSAGLRDKILPALGIRF